MWGTIGLFMVGFGVGWLVHLLMVRVLIKQILDQLKEEEI